MVQELDALPQVEGRSKSSGLGRLTDFPDLSSIPEQRRQEDFDFVGLLLESS